MALALGGPASHLDIDTANKASNARLAKLAVLAAATVDGRVHDLTVATGLALHAGAGARKGPAAGLRNLIAAFDAVVCSLAGGQAGAGGEHAVGNGVFDLVQNRAIARPTASHGAYDVPRCSGH